MLTLVVQWTTPKEGHLQRTGILEETSKNACTIAGTLATSGIYNNSNTDPNSKTNGRVQASSMEFTLSRMKLVAYGVVKLLRAERIRFLSDPNAAQPSQGVPVSIGP